MQFAVTADCHFPVQNMPCFTVRMNIQTKRLTTPAELRQRPGLTGDNRGSTGKVFKCLIPPG
ncbi:hypothetical protein DPMN_098299 [Dreissena polymorpha]|uniref:Uncharacterized protein n=1 Tax=Dreissena polymorpha TaxID=45954 RepID=A0A9D4LDB6_DREPO|nr:hypothetical protein DPMN_098297 [Dreissena polymorpha]KAH3855729.1 hypothetical protein DPMN_098299 [Dreissena polymorpha]